MAEIWELVDINKNETGVMHERGKEAMIPEGMYHLVVEIWVKNSKGEILLTQRHPNKKEGLLWECSGGSVLAGEKSVEGAARELFEETGILVDKKQLIHLGDTKKSNYIVDTYLLLLNDSNIELQLQAEEVVDAVWVPVAEIMNRKERVVKGALERYLQFEKQIKIIK